MYKPSINEKFNNIILVINELTSQSLHFRTICPTEV